jgi:hypothetical protein
MRIMNKRKALKYIVILVALPIVAYCLYYLFIIGMTGIFIYTLMLDEILAP